jgi:hypothetical protein
LKKSGRHLVIGDQQKTSWLEEAIFPLQDGLSFDLEPMVPGAGQRKAEGTWLSATSKRQAGWKRRFFLFKTDCLLTSSRWCLELDKEKRKAPGYRRPAKDKLAGRDDFSSSRLLGF